MKIGIVGTGAVGSAAAYALVLQGIGRELVLVDHNPAMAQAHRLDILHATPFSHALRVSTGSFEALAGCSIVILAAGVGQIPGETRLQLLARNAAVFGDVIPQIMSHASMPILLVATNPLDVMTHIATKLSGLPAQRVIGTGTMLDTARLRAVIGERYQISPKSVHAFVLGEHGDSEVIAWSSAEIAGLPLEQFAAAYGEPLTTSIKADIDCDVRRAAYRIIEGKGATYYGIGAALARLVRCVLQDERMVLSVSSAVANLEETPDVSYSLPRIIGAEGVIRTIAPRLDSTERTALADSANIISTALSGIGFK